mgnify:FL=1
MAASGPLFHASEGIFELDFCTKSPFVIPPPALPAALRFRAFWEHRDSDLIRIRRKSAFSRLGIVAGGLADLRGEREPPGCAKSRQRPSLDRVTTNQNRSYISTNSPDSKRFRKLIRNCYSRLLQVEWQPLKRSASPCIAVNGCRWFYKPDPGLLPLGGSSSTVPSFRFRPLLRASHQLRPRGAIAGGLRAERKTAGRKTSSKPGTGHSGGKIYRYEIPSHVLTMGAYPSTKMMTIPTGSTYFM